MYPGRLDEILEAEHRRITALRHIEYGDPSYLPIFLTGGIGDCILVNTTLRRLKKEGYSPLIYSHHADAIRYFYPDLQILKGDFPNLKWCIHLDSVAKFKFAPGFGGFLLPEHSFLFERQKALFHERPDLGYLIDNHPQHKAILVKKAAELGHNAVTFPLFCLGFENVEPEPHRPRKPAESYITIHDGFDLNNMHTVSSRCTKQWKWEHWNELVRLLHGEFPGREIIQIGSRTSRFIDGVDINMVNRTTLPEAFDLISKAALHIDTDSGLAHAATAMSVPVIAIFGPSPKDFYGHVENANLFSTKTCSGGCFHLGSNWQVGWMDKCPIGYQVPKCMDDVEPHDVLSAAQERLSL